MVPGRGYSCETYAHTVCANGVAVGMRHYTPGPFDLLAYGADSPLSCPSSTYEVYCDIEGLADAVRGPLCRQSVEQLHAGVDKKAMEHGKPQIWSPDGEGELWWCFSEGRMDSALAFAASLNSRLQ